MSTRRVSVVVVLLLVAFGVLTMHLMSVAGGSAPMADSTYACHHEGSCPESPMRHLDMVCLASAIVLVVALALITARRSSSHRLGTAIEATIPDLGIPRSVPRITELCILRC